MTRTIFEKIGRRPVTGPTLARVIPRNQSALRVMQTLYCEGDFSRCARFQSVSQGVVPPKNLLPDGSALPAQPTRKN